MGFHSCFTSTRMIWIICVKVLCGVVQIGMNANAKYNACMNDLSKLLYIYVRESRMSNETERMIVVVISDKCFECSFSTQGPVEGFKIVLHSPTEIPLPSKNFFRVPLEQV